jgi:hypothetical protein
MLTAKGLYLTWGILISKTLLLLLSLNQTDGTTTGTYITDYYVHYQIAGTPNTIYECTITISEYGGVGGLLAGTFSTTTGPILITDGEFRVIRTADDSSIMWPPE